MPRSLTFAAFLDSLRRSVALLRAFPFRWLLFTILFLAAVESLMFIPYIGFVVKLAVAGVLYPQWMLMFADADAGRKPMLRTFLGGFARPVSELWVLIVAGVIPFLIGIAYLMIAGGGWQGAAFFFGHFGATRPPDVDRYLAFKVVMNVVGMAFVFVPGAVALRGLSGLAALVGSLRAAACNWAVVLFFFAMSVAFEFLSNALPALLPLPKLSTGILLVVLLIAFLAWSISFAYTISAHAFGLKADRSSIPAADCRAADAGSV